MKRLQSRKDCKGYTLMRQLLINLELNNSDYNWLITDIEAYPQLEEINNLVCDKEFLILSTKELMDILYKEDFQWIWAVFSAIPTKYSKNEILKYELPHIQPINRDDNPFDREPRIQHPLAEIEIGAWDSSGMFIVSENKELLGRFKKYYPLARDTFNSKVVFDDWQVREKNVFETRKKEYIFCLISIIVLTAISFVATILEWYLCIMLILVIICLFVFCLEWLKIKNNHLVIAEDTIYITNRFNKTKEYIVDYKDCKLELKKSVKRGGGKWLKFYGADNKLICKYEDMLNNASDYGSEPTKWEKSIKGLNIRIIDKEQIFKN